MVVRSEFKLLACLIGFNTCKLKLELRTRAQYEPAVRLSNYDALLAAVSGCADGLFGCGVIRRYGFGALQPPGNFSFAASSDNDGTMITSSPSFQFTGVATLYFDVNCNESITRRSSSKLRPQLAGYVIISLIFLSGPMTKTERTVNTSLISG